MNHTQRTDAQLIEAYQAGDREALDTLARKHYPVVHKNALYRMRDSEAAQEIAQEVFLRVTRALHRFRMDSEFTTWLHCITKRVCIDHIRAAAARPYMVELDSPEFRVAPVAAKETSPAEDAEYGELTQWVDRIVEEMPDKQRRVFQMRHYEHMKLADIAGALDRNLGTVKAHLFTARSRVRESLDPSLINPLHERVGRAG